MTSIVRLSTLTAIVSVVPLILIGCGILPSIPAYTSENESREARPEGRDLRTRVNVERAELASTANPEALRPFVGIAISGGGSRAAAFATGVLHELDKMGFLSNVTTISSVSGGGLPAAYFALNGDQIKTEVDWEHFHALIRTPFLSKWLGRYFRPDNLLLNLVTDYDRSNTMAEVFDDVLFHNRTFDDLGKKGPRRPTLLINATELGLSEARQFTFTGQGFIAALDSRLQTYPLSRAVMASAAFPGVFNAVTLKSFVTNPLRKEPLPPSYVHLIDGGASDNLGVESLLAAARAHRGAEARSNFACFLFVVDAYPPNAEPAVRFQRDPRDGPMDYLVDSNFIDAFDALLARRREATLRDLGFQIEIRGAADSPYSDLAWPSRTNNLRGGFYAGEERLSRYVRPYQRIVTVPLGRSNEASRLENATCRVWHIAMSEVASIPYSAQEIPPVAGPLGEARDPVLVYRQRLWHMTSRIKTDFNLIGPANCSPDTLQVVLRDSAYILINEDDASRQSACDWFTANFPTSTLSCGARTAPLRTRDLNLSIDGARPNVAIKCGNQRPKQIRADG
jgi:NTE family protein